MTATILALTRTNKEFVRHLIKKAGLTRLHLLVRKSRGENVDHLLCGSLAERFSAIYRNGLWLESRGTGSLSGFGSELGNTRAVRESLPALLRAIRSDTLLDLGCGDFNWMREVPLPCRYIGADIVREVIEEVSARFGSERRTFAVLDATSDSLPAADTILCREVMFHLSFRDIRRLIENIRRSGASFLIATTDNGLRLNADIISGDFRMLNLQRAPFSFPKPSLSIPDDSVCPERVLAVWKVAALPDLVGRGCSEESR